MSSLARYRIMASEAWAAYKYYNAAPELFEAWVAQRFYQSFNGHYNYSYDDCMLMAKGFCMGIKFTVLGEMEFKQAWDSYQHNLDSMAQGSLSPQ